jgi:hypothetical protein
MKNVLLACLIVSLCGCKITTEVANKEDAIHFEKGALGNVEPGAVEVKVEKEAVHIEKEAVHVEKEAVHVEKEAVHVEKDAIGHVEAGAFKVEQGAVSVTGTVQPGAFQFPMTVQEGAVQIPLTVSEGAVKVNLALNVAEGAIVIKGAEAGAIQTKIETPWWAWLIMAALGVGWLITKFRRHKTRRREIDSKEEPSLMDIFF